MWHTHTHTHMTTCTMQFYSAIEKYETILFSGKWMELGRTCHVKWSKPVTTASITCFLSFVEDGKKLNPKPKDISWK
jgi:hypothetical protein